MDIVNIQLAISLLEPLYVLFGWLTRVFYEFFGNYGVAIIVLTVLIRGLLIPLNVQSQKSMLKMQALSGKQAELQRKYGDDKQKYQEELTKLQQENGAMGCSGCILPFLQLFLIWPIYRIVSGPLRYISQVSVEDIKSMIDYAKSAGLASRTLSDINHIGLIKLLNNNSTFLQDCINNGWIKVSQLVDLHFLGMDLTNTPSYNPADYIKNPAVYFPLLMFPVLVVVIQLISMKMTTWLKPGYKEEQEKKRRAKNNPALSGQVKEDSAEASMKIMTWTMPFVMLVTTFTLPAAMGLYWVVGGIMGILTQLLVFVLFTKPYELKKAEVEAKKAAAFKKSAGKEDSKKSKKKN